MKWMMSTKMKYTNKNSVKQIHVKYGALFEHTGAHTHTHPLMQTRVM